MPKLRFVFRSQVCGPLPDAPGHASKPDPASSEFMAHDPKLQPKRLNYVSTEHAFPVSRKLLRETHALALQGAADLVEDRGIMAERHFEAVRDVCKRTQRGKAAMRQIVLHGMRPRFEFLPGFRLGCTSRAISRDSARPPRSSVVNVLRRPQRLRQVLIQAKCVRRAAQSTGASRCRATSRR